MDLLNRQFYPTGLRALLLFLFGCGSSALCSRALRIFLLHMSVRFSILPALRRIDWSTPKSFARGSILSAFSVFSSSLGLASLATEGRFLLPELDLLISPIFGMLAS